MSIESEIERIVERVLARRFAVMDRSYTSNSLPLSIRTKRAFARICKTSRAPVRTGSGGRGVSRRRTGTVPEIGAPRDGPS
jgi:hypothetical protein